MKSYAPHKASAQKLQQFVSEAFRKVGVPDADAERTARMLVAADLRGIESHGMMNLREYISGIRNGAINPTPDLQVASGSPTTVSVDGDRGLGFVVGYRAMSECTRMAREYGTGWATACNSTHSGAGAYYVLMAVEQDMIGMHWSTGGSTVAAPGGKRRLIGNNVMAFGAPGRKHGPFVLDMAPTMAIANKLHMLQWAGEPMPEGWAVDQQGRPVTDPTRYFAEPGAILPLGSTPRYGVHKGFGLLLIIDILSGMLSGDGGSMLRKKGEHSHAFCAVRIDAFPSGGAFKDLLDEMIEKLHGTPTVAGVDRVRYPGERGNATTQDRTANGIPLQQYVADDLQRLADELRLPFEQVWQK